MTFTTNINLWTFHFASVSFTLLNGEAYYRFHHEDVLTNRDLSPSTSTHP